jgi:NAD-dependent DNA ligase
MKDIGMKQIEPPKNCPSCQYGLHWKKDVLFCTNESCNARSQKSVQHWAKTLKIKGLGPRAIEKLELVDISDIYSLQLHFVKDALGSEKLAVKLLEEIAKSKKADLLQSLPAFGIPLIGNSATQKLSSVITRLDDLTEAKAREAGLGPKATENLMEWFLTRYKKDLKVSLPLSFEFLQRVKQDLKPDKGVVCISGKLKSYKTKALATKDLESCGYVVKPSITKEVTILVNESGVESAKTEKARASGITIVTDIKQLIGD